MRKSNWILGILLGFVLAAIPDVALACPSCYGAISNTEVAQGIQLAMVVLIGVTAVIGTGVVLFFSNINKRSKLYGLGENESASTDR